jgi:hypothetical protein
MNFAWVLLAFYLYVSVRPVYVPYPSILKGGWSGFS